MNSILNFELKRVKKMRVTGDDGISKTLKSKSFYFMNLVNFIY